jgi:hypothetical protein
VPTLIETREPYVLGKVAPGKNYREVLRRGMNFGGDRNEIPWVQEMNVWRDGEIVKNNWQ